jgi:hypothetical protein
MKTVADPFAAITRPAAIIRTTNIGKKALAAGSNYRIPDHLLGRGDMSYSSNG